MQPRSKKTKKKEEKEYFYDYETGEEVIKKKRVLLKGILIAQTITFLKAASHVEPTKTLSWEEFPGKSKYRKKKFQKKKLT